MSEKPTIYVILGPTAAGKTSYGITLANERSGAVISADSRQIYAGMNIGTAKPPEAWLDTLHSMTRPDVIQGIDHYLFNVRTPNEPWTLSQWQAAAKDVITKVLGDNKVPIIVGGTMLYIDSILKNYSIPPVTPDQQLRNELEKKSPEELYTKLLEKDPDAQAFIEPHHKQRIIRALEVIQSTGTSFSSLRKEQPSPYDFQVIGIFPGWNALEKRVTSRAKEMFEIGLIKETQQLQETYGSDLPLLKTMNYAQAVKVLAGEYTFEQAIEETVRVNMRYTRRQMSWWKSRTEIRWQ